MADPEQSSLSGSWAMLSLYALSGVDGSVAKEASVPFQACHLEIYAVPVVIWPSLCTVHCALCTMHRPGEELVALQLCYTG